MSFGDQTETTETTTTSTTEAGATPPVTLTVNGKELTLEEAAKKIENQDQFIETLKQERAADVETNTVLATRVETIEAALQTQDGLKQLLDGVTKPTTTAPPETPAVKQVSTEELTELVKAGLRQDEVVAKQKSNMESSMAAAEEAYGEGYVGKIIAAGKAAGYSVDGIDDLANNHPTAFAKLFLPETKAETETTTATTSTVGGGVGQQGAAAPVHKTYSKMLKASERSADIARRIAEKEAAANN